MVWPLTAILFDLDHFERVRAAIAEIQLFEENLSVTASFGVAVFPDLASDVGLLIRSADRALDQAKAKGRNRVEVFSTGTHSDGSQSVLQNERA
jgi:GGDEF domain-containing protein